MHVCLVTSEAASCSGDDLTDPDVYRRHLGMKAALMGFVLTHLQLGSIETPGSRLTRCRRGLI